MSHLGKAEDKSLDGSVCIDHFPLQQKKFSVIEEWICVVQMVSQVSWEVALAAVAIICGEEENLTGKALGLKG